MFKNNIIVVFLMFVSLSTVAQKYESNWSLSTGYEANYTGNNVWLHVQFLASDKHKLEAGLMYNASDGFSDRLVIGIDLAYNFIVLQKNNWEAAVGMDYRRQKPLEIVNIQMLCYTNSVNYLVTKNIAIQTKVGYGIAAERSASAGNFSQSNNLSGLISIGCVYHL